MKKVPNGPWRLCPAFQESQTTARLGFPYAKRVTSGVPPGGRPMTAIMARAASLQPASMIPRSGGWLGSFSAAPLAKRFRRGFYAGVALCRHGGVSLGVVKGSGKLEDGYFATACSGA